MTSEMWLPVGSHPELYEVSSLGRVRSMTTRVLNGGGTRIRNGRVLKFNITPQGYATVMLSRDSIQTRVLVSRLVAQAFIGNIDGFEIDHINRDRQDNRLCNLRKATTSQNHLNTNTPISNTSGFKGVSWHKARGKWRAIVSFGGKSKHLGHFDTAEAAAKRYLEVAKAAHGEFFPNV